MAVDSSSADTGHGRLPEAVVEELLVDPRRRAMLRSLWAHDGPVPMTQLAARVIARERSVPPDAVPPEDRKRVRENLYEDHLPKFTATAVLRYNSRQASVELDDGATQLLDRLQSFDSTPHDAENRNRNRS